MTVRPPSWIQAASFSADDDRLLLQSLLGGSPNEPLSSGIVGGADYKVAQTVSASMDLDVASGAAWIVGSQSSTEGIYNVVNDDNTATVTIPTADLTNPRIDLVVLQVRNSEYSGTDDDAILAVIEGTPGSSPSAPSAPDDSIVLARVAVAANASSITTANITDERPIFAAGPSPDGATVATSQSTTNLSYVDLSTSGPAVTRVTRTRALVLLSAKMSNNTANDGCAMSFAVSGASTIAAADVNSLESPVLTDPSGTVTQMAAFCIVAGLTPGSNTFTAKYRTSIGGTATFADRAIAVIPL